MILNYFLHIKTQTQQYSSIIEDFTITQKSYSETKGFINGNIYFADESQLDFSEVKDTDSTEKIKYRYHYMDKENTMVFRYDNARHFPNPPTFPHHKHTPTEVIASNEVELAQVLQETEKIVVKK